MFNLHSENVSEHSHEVSIMAHAIAVIGFHSYNKTYNPERIATIAIYHEASESAVGDQPSTLKHATNDTSEFFELVEMSVTSKMVNTLPKAYASHLAKLTLHEHLTKEEKDIVKAADLFSMLVKCEHEISLGNNEFTDARKKISEKLSLLMEQYPEVKEFNDVFLPRCKMTIDGLVTL